MMVFNHPDVKKKIDFHENWYECYSVEPHSRIVGLFNFLQTIITAEFIRSLVRWERYYINTLGS